MPTMPENMLDIFLITYNRSAYLETTLQQLKDSPFSRFRLTILDNSSTDDTPQVAERFRNCFPDYRVIRHSINIGGDANYLRAVELSGSIYTWIICDDDTYDWSAACEVIEVVERKEHDLIVVGPLQPPFMSRGRSGTMSELVGAGFLPHFALSFFPACIFRTALFDYDCIVKGFRLSAERYPNFAFINKMLQKNAIVYLPSSEVVVRNDVNESVLSPLSWYNGWLNCCLTIPERRLRFATIEQATSKRGFFKCLGFWIILERHINKEQFWREIFNIFFVMNGYQRMRFLLLTPVIIIPLPLRLMIAFRSLIYRILGVPDCKVPPVRVVDRDA